MKVYLSVILVLVGFLAIARSAPAPNPRFAILIYGLSAKSLSKLLIAAYYTFQLYYVSMYYKLRINIIMRSEITIVFLFCLSYSNTETRNFGFVCFRDRSCVEAVQSTGFIDCCLTLRSPDNDAKGKSYNLDALPIRCYSW